MNGGSHFGGDCGGFAGESAARPLMTRSVLAPWGASRREIDRVERVRADCSTFSVSCVSPDFVAGIEAFCFALERRSLTRFAAFPYCTRVLREETSASMSNKKTPDSADGGLVQPFTLDFDHYLAQGAPLSSHANKR